jgi:PTS system mannose-specific IIA component
LIGIVIVAHGGLATAYLSAMEHVIGISPGIVAISIYPTDKISEKGDQISKAVLLVDDGDGVIVVTDMHGSTPANLALKACKGHNREVLFGANLPLLLKLVKVRNLSFDKAINLALNAGRKYINCARPQFL